MSVRNSLHTSTQVFTMSLSHFNPVSLVRPDVVRLKMRGMPEICVS